MREGDRGRSTTSRAINGAIGRVLVAEGVVDDDLLDHRRRHDDHLPEHGRGDGEEDPPLVDRQERAEPAAANRPGAGQGPGPAGRWPPLEAPVDSSLIAWPPASACTARFKAASPATAAVRSRGADEAQVVLHPLLQGRLAARRRRAPSVSSSPTPRRSPSISMRRTQPHVTSPSSSPVSVDLDKRRAAPTAPPHTAATSRSSSGSGTAPVTCPPAPAQGHAPGRRR